MEESSSASSYTSSATTKTSTTTATPTTTSNSIDQNPNTSNSSSVTAHNALRQLNKSSYKISKPTTSKQLGGGTRADGGNPSHHKSQPPPLPPPEAPPPPPPPVYNINKNDFRDLVQKLTGFPAHHARQPSPSSAPFAPPSRSVFPPNASCGGGTSSRLHKIRPPPLAHLTPRPPPPLAPPAASNPLTQAVGDAWVRSSPLSPLPPFPTVSAAAESPITAYMKCLRSGSVPHQQIQIPSPRGGSASGGPFFPLAPSSPLGFGCAPSPHSEYQTTISPGLLFPPSSMPSPRWGDQ